jgi:hypothetical protein
VEQFTHRRVVTNRHERGRTTMTKKSVTKKPATKNTNAILNELRSRAVAHEEAGRWLDAAEAWTEVAEQAESKKPRAEASGRAAAARVRALAKPRMPTDDAHEVGTPADAAPAGPDAPTANEARDGAPGDGGSPVDAPEPAGAPTGEPDATDAPPANATELAPQAKSRTQELPPVGTVVQKRDRAGDIR